MVIGFANAAFVQGYEEPTLRETYGTRYDEYCAHVPRWLPRITPWTGATGARPGDRVRPRA